MGRPWVLAIDFGTSYTVVVGYAAGHPPEVVELDGERRMPSVVFIDEHGQFVVGRHAEEMIASRPQSVLRAPKSRLGDVAPVVIAGRPRQVPDLVAKVLDVAFRGAVRYFGPPPQRVRLTHPATWSRSRVSKLSEAAALAGIPNPGFVTEPVAAALSVWQRGELDTGANVAIYDLGGGTFDTAVLTVTDTGFEIVGRPTGDSSIGGETFDELVVQVIGSRLPESDWEQIQIGSEPHWTHARAVLHSEARRVKEALSARPYAELALALPGGVRTVRLERSELEGVLAPYLDDTVTSFERSIHDANLRGSDLSAIQLVGGSSNAPIVEQMVGDAFPGVPIHRRGDPKACVAIGAVLAPDLAALPSDRAGRDTPTPAPGPRREPPRTPAPPVVLTRPPTGYQGDQWWRDA